MNFRWHWGEFPLLCCMKITRWDLLTYKDNILSPFIKMEVRHQVPLSQIAAGQKTTSRPCMSSSRAGCIPWQNAPLRFGSSPGKVQVNLCLEVYLGDEGFFSLVHFSPLCSRVSSTSSWGTLCLHHRHKHINLGSFCSMLKIQAMYHLHLVFASRVPRQVDLNSVKAT